MAAYAPFGKRVEKWPARRAFVILAVSGVIRALIIYLAPNKYVAMTSIIFHGIWFAILWSRTTPYLRELVPPEHLSDAQGLWSVAAFGLGKLFGGYVGGVVSEALGLRSLFLMIAGIMAVNAIIASRLSDGDYRLTGQ